MLVTALLTGCGAESGPTAENAPGLTAAATDHNTADHFKFTDQIEETVVNPCNGETIQFAGTAVGQVTRVDTREHLDQGFDLHREVHAVISQTGTGQTTGASYTLRATFHEVFDSPNGPAPNSTFGLQDRGHVKSTTPGLSFTWLYTIHVVSLPSGEFKFTKLIEDGHDFPIYECRG